MIFGRRIWTAMALALIVWLLPAQGFCFETDPYAYKSLTGRVHFEYQRNTNEQGQSQTTSHSFLQRYSLDLRGYAVNRRLLIYDAGYSYTNSDYSSSNTGTNTGTSNYSIRTTALPLSAIPLTLYAYRRSSTSSSGSAESTNSQNRYGFIWHLNFRTLPKTSISAERDQLVANDGNRVTTDTYRLEMEKELGPTYNYFSYYLINTGDSSQYAINFSNSTRISRTTTFTFGATRSEGESSTNLTSDITAINLSLNSNPSKDFSQRHSYSYYSNETGDETQTGSIYTGNMRYNFSKRLDATYSLSVDNTKSSTVTSASESTSLSTAMSARYSLTNSTNISQLVSYTKNDYNSNDTATNISDIETLRTLTSVNHFRRLNWAFFSASAGVGYTDEKSGTDRAGQAIEQNYSLSLSDIDLNKYVGAGTSINYSTRTTISGNDISDTRYSYNLSLYNKMWRKYLIASGSYTMSATKTYFSDIENRNEKYELKGVSAYFKNTKFDAAAIQTRTFDGLVGHARATTMSVGASHNRQLYKGQLGLGYNFSTTKSTYEGGSDKVNYSTYNLSYARTLFKDITWIFTATMATQEASSSHSSRTSIKNSMRYQLRSWLLTGDYEYRISEYSKTERTETILMLKATRVFLRAW